MKQNITLRLDKDLLKKGKALAARNDTSISKMLGAHLKEIIEREERAMRLQSEAPCRH